MSVKMEVRGAAYRLYYAHVIETRDFFAIIPPQRRTWVEEMTADIAYDGV